MSFIKVNKPISPKKMKEMENSWRKKKFGEQSSFVKVESQASQLLDGRGKDEYHPEAKGDENYFSNLNVKVNKAGRPRPVKSAPAPGKIPDVNRQMNAKNAVMRAVANLNLKMTKREPSEHQTVALRQYLAQNETYFASNKAGPDYDQFIKRSMARYMEYKQPNLYAIVMGSGHGKSTLSKRYGVIDIDDLVTESEHNQLVEERRAIIERDGEWKQHNERWFAAARKTLSIMDMTQNSVVLVHTEEAALSLGAKVMGGISLAESALANNVKHRAPFERLEAKGNLMRNQAHHSTYTPLQCRDRIDVERAFLTLMNVNSIPVAAPYKYPTKYRNSCYSATCPDWVLEGRMKQGTNLYDVVKMYEAGMVPKECVDYYVKQFEAITYEGFGVTLNDWAKLCAKVAAEIEEPNRNFNLEEKDDVNEMFPFGSVRERNRANCTIRRLMKVFKIQNHPEVIEIMSHHVGQRNIFVTSVIAAWKGLMQDLPMHTFARNLMKVRYPAWTKVMKDVHNFVRTSNFLFQAPINEDQRQKLMYMDLLIGRTDYELTVEMALENRTGADPEPVHLAYDPDRGMWNRAQYRKMFKVALTKVHLKVKQKPRKVNVNGFLQFYKYKRNWMTKGSLVMNNIDAEKKRYMTYILDELNDSIIEYQGLHNKASFFETHDIMDMIDNRKGMFNSTKAMKKYEIGDKFRVLLPGSLLHYIIFSYVLYVAEKQEQIGTVRLNSPPDEDMLFFDRKMNDDLHHMLYDWADFNSQHSKWEMYEVVQELRHIPTAPNDYAMFVDVIASGMYDMWLVDGEGNKHELSNGLFSGWRGTTWINSVLNNVYIIVALECFAMLYGANSLAYIDHGGDDIDLAMLEPGDALRFLRVMEAMKFDAQLKKQLFSKTSEFFRVTITKDRAYASPTRGLASFIAGDWEGAGRATVRERVQGISDQIGKLKRRGLDEDVARGLQIAALSHWCRVKVDEEWLDLPDEVIHGMEEQGGLGVPDAYGCVWRLDRDVPVLAKEGEKKIVPGFNSSEDYVHTIMEDLGKQGLTISRPTEYAQQLAQDNFTFAGSPDSTDWASLCSQRFHVEEYVSVITAKHDLHTFEEMLMFEKKWHPTSMYGHVNRFLDMVGYIEQDGKSVTKEELVKIVGSGEVTLEAVEFQGSQHYRRLVPDFWGLKITDFCRHKLNGKTWTLEQAKDKFETMCYMVKDIYGHQM